MANRLVFGLHGGIYKFRISKPGVDVLTAGVNDLLFSDALATRMVQRIITGSVIVPGGGGDVNVTHANYGSVPYLFYRAASGTGTGSYYYINYNFSVYSRTATGFSINNANTPDQRVYYWLWIV